MDWQKYLKLKIVTMRDPILKQKARILGLNEIASLSQLIVMMKNTMHDAPGVGIAAPQVGVPIQLTVIEDREEYHKNLTAEQLQERERKVVPFTVLINPEITFSSEDKKEFYEGCLSIPGVMGLVSRASKVKVNYLNENGESKVITANGWFARILQHEIDHLNGILFLDRATSLVPSPNFENFWGKRTFDDVIKELQIQHVN